MTSKLSLKKKKKTETLNGLDDVSMDGPDSLLFINCGDIFAESIFFIFLFRFNVNYFAIRARLLTSRL